MRDRATFRALRSSRVRGRSGPITVTWVSDGVGVPRVAFVIGRKVGPAVVRNRLRRQLRAIAADAGLDPGAYLLQAAPPASAMTFGELRDSVTAALAAVPGRDHR